MRSLLLLSAGPITSSHALFLPLSQDEFPHDDQAVDEDQGNWKEKKGRVDIFSRREGCFD